MTDPILKIEGVSKSFIGHKALDHVSLEIPRGSVYGLLGPNGAGKTTLIRVITKITVPDSGRVLFNGKPITAADVATIGYMPEERGLYKKMKVGEQAVFFARLHGLDKAEAVSRLRKWFNRLSIMDWWEKKIEDLSKGMAQKIQFITTVVHEPELLIFDEPFSGFDPINANLLKEEILRLRDAGSTIIFSTHNMSSVEEICDYMTLINKSQNILSGSVREIRQRAGGNMFSVTYSCGRELFEKSLEGYAHCMDKCEPQIGGFNRQKIHIPLEENLKKVIAVLNENCGLRSFEEVMPGMDDIFIRAVNGIL